MVPCRVPIGQTAHQLLGLKMKAMASATASVEMQTHQKNLPMAAASGQSCVTCPTVTMRSIPQAMDRKASEWKKDGSLR